MVEVKSELKTRVKECQGYGGAQHDKERTNERKTPEIVGGGWVGGWV